MKFEEYHIAEGIKKSISKLDYKKPTDIQFKAIPAILNGDDVLAVAQTGTGKTAAYVIPVLDILHRKKSTSRQKGIRCLVMTPTHELARQTELVFKKLGKHVRVEALSIYGGVDQDPQIEKLQKGVDVLIATPGRLFDLAYQKVVELNSIEILVVDEADHMLDLGFIKDIRDLMHHLPKRRQTLFFSATIDEKIKKLAYTLVNNPINIRISPKDPVGKTIDHGKVYVEMDDKRFFLERIIKENEDKKILVFVRTKIRAERVKKAMERVGIKSETIHSDKSQNERNLVLSAFSKGESPVLIATDVSARGIDIPNVEYVINYDLPEIPENYVHRVGRTGRAKARGTAISFCSSEEKEILINIEKRLGKPIKELELTKSDYQETIEFSQENSSDWQSLLDNEDKWKKEKGKRKK